MGIGECEWCADVNMRDDGPDSGVRDRLDDGIGERERRPDANKGDDGNGSVDCE